MKAAIIGIFEDFKTKTFEGLDKELDGILTKFTSNNKKAKKYKGFTTITKEWDAFDIIYVVGLGKASDYDVHKHRKLVGNVVKRLQFESTFFFDTFLPQDANITEYALATSEAIHLAQQKHINFKTDKKTEDDVLVEIKSKYHIKDALHEGELLSYSVGVARDLLNTPSNYLTPTELALVIEAFADAYSLPITILERRHMERAGMGGILGVSKGSTENPKLIVVRYLGGITGGETLALVGKGVTFDTGGYSMKSPTAMYGMHGDMGGAATVFGAFCAIVEAKLPINVMLVIPAVENMVSAEALKPGDVIKMLNGKTVEVNNTDAEGRLILADGLVYAARNGATRIIDAATLTGAIISALGDHTTGVFTNSDEFVKQFLAIAKESGESAWQMPIFEPEISSLKTSAVADYKNSAGSPGAITAAAFLQEFIEKDLPWIHLDVAGSAESKNPHDLGPKGATGAMIRTIYNYAKTLR